MSRIQFSFLALTLFALTAAPSFAEEPPAAKEPLQVIEDCIKAAEAEDFARYVDHLSTDEQLLQAGYIVYVTRSMSSPFDDGAPVWDPEMLLMTRSMRGLVAQHTVAEVKREAEYQAAENFLARLAGEVFPSPYEPIPASPPGLAPARPYGNPQGVWGGPEIRKQLRKSAGVLSDPRGFLVDALAELARPTSISGEEASQSSTRFDMRTVIKLAKETKWTLYTRGDHAIAVAPKSEAPREPARFDPYAPAVPAQPQSQVEFMRVDGQWKISRLLPGHVAASGRLAGGVF